MARQIKSCTNNTHFEPINCDTYSDKLLKQKNFKMANRLGCAIPRCSRDRIVSNTRVTNAAKRVPSTPIGLKSRMGFRQENVAPPRKPNNSTGFSEREYVSDNPTLSDVNFRSNSAIRKPTTSDRNRNEPWENVFKSAKSTDNLSSFGSFDPLRTIHFLAKELHSKIKAINPDDNKVIEMITDMQHALNRVPSEISSTIRLQEQHEKPTLKRSASEIRSSKNKLLSNISEPPEKLNEVKPLMENRSSQTKTCYKNFSNSNQFQKQLEANASKLETSCKQMEVVCTQLKNEKEQAEHLLRSERDTVAFLRKQIGELETEKIESSNLAYRQLTEERNTLQAQVNSLQMQLDSYQGPSAQKLKFLVQELQLEKAAIEQDNLSLRHKLTLCNMEKEKYIAILSVRDRQINEIKSEMHQLQEVVNDQLMELQKSPFTSSPSSQSTLILAANCNDSPWQKVQLNNEKCDKDKDVGDSSGSPVRHLFTNNTLLHSFQELPSGDSSSTNFECMTSKIQRNEQDSTSPFLKVPALKLPSGSKLEKLIASERTSPAHDNIQSNIRGMFTELKRQAFLLNVPLPTPPVDNHAQDTQQSNNNKFS